MIKKFYELEQYQNFKLNCYQLQPFTKLNYNEARNNTGENIRVKPETEVLAMPILIREAKSYTRYFYPNSAHGDWSGKCKVHDIKLCQACSHKVFEDEEKKESIKCH